MKIVVCICIIAALASACAPNVPSSSDVTGSIPEAKFISFDGRIVTATVVTLNGSHESAEVRGLPQQLVKVRGKDYRIPYPVARRVSGRSGVVYNPYTLNFVNVKGIRSGELIDDPDDPDPTHKFWMP